MPIEPGHYWSRLQLARCYLSMSRFAEAVEALGACIALRQEEDSRWAYSARALALAGMRHFGEALDDLNRVLQEEPDFHPAKP
jgi:tetratricopeptide (TPR) repeat protein